MMWREHAFIGALSAALILFMLGEQNLLFLIIFALMGGLSALVPDLDHHASKGRQWLDKAVPLASFATAYIGECGSTLCVPTLETAKTALALIGVYFVVFTFCKPKHRGITHSVFALLIYMLLLYSALNLKLALAGGIGYLSHLLADREFKLF